MRLRLRRRLTNQPMEARVAHTDIRAAMATAHKIEFANAEDWVRRTLSSETAEQGSSATKRFGGHTPDTP